MDDIKTNIEKIFDQFSNSIATAVPKRLSFDNGDDTTFRTTQSKSAIIFKKKM